MKRSIKTIIALALVGCMSLGSTILAGATMYNDGKDHPNEEGGDEPIIAENDTTVTVTGDIDTDSYCGIQAGDGSSITVNGNITAGEEAVVVNKGTANVTGDVTGGVDGIHSDDGGEVTVTGNVNGNITVTDADVEVNGNVIGTDKGAAIEEHGDSVVVVNGNVNSSAEGINTDGDSTVVITGTLTVAGGNPIVLFDHSEMDPNTYKFTSKEAGPSKIAVYEIKGDLDNLVKSVCRAEDGGHFDANNNYVKDYNVDTNDTLKKAQEANVFYIIKKAPGSEDKFVGNIDGTEKIAGYDAAQAEKPITVRVKEGYGVTAGKIEVTKNADGSYSIIVPKGGGVTLTAEALKEAVEEIAKEEEKEEKKEEEKKEDKKKDSKDDDKKEETSTPAATTTYTNPVVSYAPVLTMGGSAVTFAGATFGADTGIKMEEPGPLAEAAFIAAMPEGFTKGFSFSVTNGGQTTYSIKNGKISFKIPAQYLLAGRQFKLIGVDKDGNTKVFDNAATEDGSFEADIDIEGYQFELVYKD